MLVNLHRLRTNNIGDLRCAPSLYFGDRLPMQRHEILGFRPGEIPKKDDRAAWIEQVKTARAIVFGGGGLLNIDFFRPAFEYINALNVPGQKRIIWGAGHNAWQIGDWRHLKPTVILEEGSFDLIGIRDDNQPYEWVPCASCMDPIFDTPSAPVTELAVYAHADTLNNPNLKRLLPSEFPILDNHATFEDAISFIANCDLLLTDSYHGVFWATLLGRRCVAFPSSSKFYDLRHPVPLCDASDWCRFERLAVRYPGALDECRAANMAFADKVANIV